LLLGRNLNNNTNDIEERRGRDGPFAAKAIADPSRGKTANERTDAEQAHDGSLARSTELAVLAEAREEVGHGEETYSPVSTCKHRERVMVERDVPEI
jgi:hypothetical protein